MHKKACFMCHRAVFMLITIIFDVVVVVVVVA